MNSSTSSVSKYQHKGKGYGYVCTPAIKGIGEKNEIYFENW